MYRRVGSTGIVCAALMTMVASPGAAETTAFTADDHLAADRANLPYRVPAGVCWARIAAAGGSGGDGGTGSLAGGLGATVSGTLRVRSREILWVNAGGAGSPGTPWGSGRAAGGSSGGGSGFAIVHTYAPFPEASRTWTRFGAGGGGASDVRRGGVGLASRVVVAGGGGGGGAMIEPEEGPVALSTAAAGRSGGDAGYPAGESGAGDGGGQGGTQLAGGAAGVNPPLPIVESLVRIQSTSSGRRGYGGNALTDPVAGGGGGGGGGLFGGGAGAGAAGGGGSSYAAPAVSAVVHGTAATPGDGSVRITAIRCRDRTVGGSAPSPARGPAVAPRLRLAVRAPRSTRPGRWVRYRIAVRNVGRATARRVRLRVAVPRAIERRRGALATASGRAAVWRLGAIAPGRRKIVTLRARVAPGARARLVARVVARASNARATRTFGITRVRPIAARRARAASAD